MSDTMWFLLGGDLFTLSLIGGAIAIVCAVVTWPLRAYRRARARKGPS